MSVESAGTAVEVEVLPAANIDIDLPGVVRISGADDALIGDQRLTVQPVVPTLGADTSVLFAAGTGVRVEFPGSQLAKPLLLEFVAAPRPDSSWDPASMHIRDDGTMDLVPAVYVDGAIVVETSDFSVHIPVWLNPKKWWDGLLNGAAGILGGRTSPDACPPSGQRPAPSWAYVDGPNNGSAHVCLFENSDGGGDRVEVQLKSNRGVYLIFTPPAGVDYVWTASHSSLATTAARKLKVIDASEHVIAPGDLLTYGYRRSATGAINPRAVVHANNATIVMSGITALVGDVFGWYSLVECVADPEALEVSAGSLGDVLKCLLGIASRLEDPDEALAAVRSIYGNSIDSGTLDQQASFLVDQANKFQGWGIVFKLIGTVLGLGPILSQLSDAVVELFKPGTGDVTINISGPAIQPTTPNTPATVPVATNAPALAISGSCTSTSGTLNGSSSGFTPGGRYTVSAWYPNGSPYTNLIATGQVRADGTIKWTWPCAGDPSGTYTTEVRDDSTGRTTGRVSFTIGAGQQPPATPAPTTPSGTTYAETTGGVANTWTNYTNAGGQAGPQIPRYATVQIACKIRGFAVANGNTWWYRIASPPWNGVYYVSADVFYNNGQTSGSLAGTPYVDPVVPDC